jgi:iron complex outermembrane receptor protein
MITTLTFTPVLPPRSRGVRKVAFLRSACALAAFALAGGLSAQTAAPADSKPADPDKTIQLEKLVVSGYRASLAASLDEKRKAGANIDVITAQDVGKFPDTNLAESLSHIPGVTIDRLFGEGERVSILGTDPSLNRTLLNGQPIATADWYILDTPSRQFNYALLAPEVIGQAAVYRTWEPRLLEGSIGGTIIVNTASPLKGQPFAAAVSATESYNGLSKKYEPSFSGTVSWHNDSKTLGIMVGAQDSKDYIRRDGVEALGVLGNYTDSSGIVVQNNFSDPSYPQVGVATQPSAAGPNKGFVMDEVINTALFEQLRHRQGANGAIEYKVSENFEIDYTGLFVNENMDNTNTSFYPMYMTGSPVANPTFSNGLLTSGSYTGNQIEVDLFARKAQIKTQVHDFKFIYTSGDFKLTGDVGYTRATGGTTMQAYRGANIFDPYSITEGPSSASFTAVTGPTYATTGDVTLNSSQNAGWGGLVEEPEVDQEKWAQADFEVPLKNDFLSKLLVGFRSSAHDTSEFSAHQVAFFGPGERNYLALFQAAPGNFLSGLSGITSSMATHPVGNFNAIFNQTANTPASATDISAGYWPGVTAGQTLAQYSVAHPYAVINDWLALPTDSATVGPTFNAKEVINAMYFEAPFHAGHLSGNFGVRFVETATTGTSINVGRISGSPYAGALPGGQPLTAASLGQYGAPGYQPIPVPAPGQTQAQANMAAWTQAQYDATEVPITAKVDNTYTNILPALNLAYDAGRDQVIRFAMAEVMSRPNLLQEFGYTTLYPINTPGDIGGNGVGGTTGLNPYKSVNLDLDYEYYFAKNSYFSVDVFYKDIENYIVNVTTPEIHANTTTWEDQYFYVTRPQNGGKATSKGVALSYQQEFANGFGLSANYTHLSAQGVNGQLPFASKNQINIGPYFENRRGLVRLTYSWRDDFATGSFNGSSTVFTRPYTSLDANASINLGKNFSLTLTARNLLNESYQQYFSNPIAGGSQLFADAYKTGRGYSAGVHYKF